MIVTVAAWAVGVAGIAYTAWDLGSRVRRHFAQTAAEMERAIRTARDAPDPGTP